MGAEWLRQGKHVQCSRDSRGSCRRKRSESARGFVEDVDQRIDRLAVEVDFVVEMVPGGPTGVAHIADDVAAPDSLAGLNGESRQMTVPGRETVPVGDIDGIPQAPPIASVCEIRAGARIPSVLLATWQRIAVRMPPASWVTTPR